jgi:hypothetical protein
MDRANVRENVIMNVGDMAGEKAVKLLACYGAMNVYPGRLSICINDAIDFNTKVPILQNSSKQ